MNGFLKTTFHGTRQVLKQLVFTTLLKQRLRFEDASDDCRGRHKIEEHTYALGKIRQHKLGPADKDVLSECTETYLLATRSRVQVAGQILRESTVFYSCLLNREGSKNNRVYLYVINGQAGVGEIDYLYDNSQCLKHIINLIQHSWAQSERPVYITKTFICCPDTLFM